MNKLTLLRFIVSMAAILTRTFSFQRANVLISCRRNVRACSFVTPPPKCAWTLAEEDPDPGPALIKAALEEHADKLKLRRKAAKAKKETSDPRWDALGRERYSLDRDLIVGTVAYMFREDVMQHVFKRRTRNKVWETEFLNMTKFFDVESFHTMELVQQKKLLFYCSLLNGSTEMNGVHVEDVVWALERCTVPIHVPASSDEDKLHFLHTFGMEFTFLPEDSADKRLLERMRKALRRHLEREILRAEVAAFKLERRKMFPKA